MYGKSTYDTTGKSSRVCRQVHTKDKGSTTLSSSSSQISLTVCVHVRAKGRSLSTSSSRAKAPPAPCLRLTWTQAKRTRAGGRIKRESILYKEGENQVKKGCLERPGILYTIVIMNRASGYVREEGRRGSLQRSHCASTRGQWALNLLKLSRKTRSSCIQYPYTWSQHNAREGHIFAVRCADYGISRKSL